MDMKRIIFAFGLALAVLSASAARLDYTFNFSGAPSEGYGTGKAETYDVAVRIANPSFVGAKIHGIRVAVPKSGVSAVSAWLTSGLNLKKKNGKNVNDPDIASVGGTPADGWLDIAFTQPYAVPAEGVYVGYSFTVDEPDAGTAAPVSVARGTSPDGLFLHTSRTKLRWGGVSEELGMVSAMTVVLEGGFPASSAVIRLGLIQAAADEETAAYVQVVNCGSGQVSSLEYRAELPGRTFTGTARLAAPLPACIGASATASVKIPPVGEKGEHALKIRVVGIGGAAVECPETEGTLKVYPFIPANRPLVEEYTGLWCGWCPLGYVALETMKERRGDLFVAAAYHNGDDMAFDGKTPNSPGGYPSAYVNRSASVNLGKIYTEWDAWRRWIPEGGVECGVEWADDAHASLRATSTARFIEGRSGADYRVSYILVADGLSNPRWKQNNYYSGLEGREDEMPGEWGSLFIGGGKYVEGLTFNDVAVAATSYDGFPGSVPPEIEAGEEYAHSYTFDVSGLDPKTFSQPGMLRVIAVLTDGKSGKVVNCASSAHADGTPFAGTDGVEEVELSISEAVPAGVWTLDGRKMRLPLDEARPGLYVVRLSDGSVRKVMVK